MRKLLIAIILIIALYCTVYFIGAPYAVGNPRLSGIWAKAFYPIRMFQQRKSPVIHEKGTITQYANGNWGLTYLTPRQDPHGHFPVDGISFRVPKKFLSTTQAYKDSIVEVGIGQEPDPGNLSTSSYVLTSIAPGK